MSPDEASRLLPSENPGEPEPDLAEAIRRRFSSFGGVDDLVPHPPVLIADDGQERITPPQRPA
jgi:hypothetical protein